MPRLRRVSLVLLTIELLVIGGCATNPDHPDNPQKHAAGSRPTTSAAPPTTVHPLLVAKRVAAVLSKLYPTTTSTTTVAVTVPDLVEPRPQDGMGDDWPMFEALAICETGLNWNHQTRDYVSAFGMARTTFNMDAHAVGLPDWYIGYPQKDQLAVARYGHYVENQFWGCGVRVPGW